MTHQKQSRSKSKIIGYARVSTHEQNLDLQTHALKQFGCSMIYQDKGISGGVPPCEREQFQSAISSLQEGDVFAVWKLDRLGRSLSTIIETIDGLARDGIEFVSLTENIDTVSATGRAFWQFIALMAELERGLIRERTIEGMKAAKARGVKIGRPRKLSERCIIEAQNKLKQGQSTLAALAKFYKVSPATLRRALLKLEKF